MILVDRMNVKYLKNLFTRLSAENITVYKVFRENKFAIVESNVFTIGDNLDDYIKLLKLVKEKNITDIIHCFTYKNNMDIEYSYDVDESLNRGFFSMFNLAKAVSLEDYEEDLRILLVADNICEVTGDEKYLKPFNSPLAGIAKVVPKEYPNLKIRLLNLDDADYSMDIYNEMMSKSEKINIAYRNGERYVEVFAEIDIKDNIEKNNLAIKDNGVYVITGGTGGIGREVARYISRAVKAIIVLAGRREVPGKEEWEKIIKEGKDKKAIKMVNFIEEIESFGSQVVVYSTDCSNEQSMGEMFEELRKRFGKIDGIIHGAGVGGAEFIKEKNKEGFMPIIAPKVYGTWIIDRLTEKDNLDFFIMFSSIATIFYAPGQSSYVSSNYFLDAYADYRNKKGKKTITIDWSTWKETGMSLEHKVNFDMLFKAMYTDDAVKGFGNVLNTNLKRVLIGYINYDGNMSGMLCNYPLDYSDKIKSKLGNKPKKKLVQNSMSKSKGTIV